MPKLHERMHRLPPTYKKLSMLPEDEPNLAEISSRRPLPSASPMFLASDTSGTSSVSQRSENVSTGTRLGTGQEMLPNRPHIQHTPNLMLNPYLRIEPQLASIQGIHESRTDERLILVTPQGTIYAPAPLYFYSLNQSSRSRF